MEATTEFLSRRERERLHRRQLIVRAARAVFAEQGYQRATLDEVAERAEFGKGTLYNYFEGGKEEILLAVFDDVFDEIYTLVDSGIVQPYRDGRPLREVFHEHVTRAFKHFLQERDLLMIMIKELQRLTFSDNQEKVAYFYKQERRMVELMVPVLEDAMAKGEIRRLPPHSVAFMLRGNIRGFLCHLCMQEDCLSQGSASQNGYSPLTVEKAAHVLTTVLFDGLQASSTNTSPHPQ